MSGAGVWPRAAVVRGLAAVAVGLGLLEVLRPGWTSHAAPAVLAAVTWAVCWLVLRHSRGLERGVATPWRGFALIAGLLALGQVLRAVADTGVNPSSSGPADLALAATGPVVVFVCVRLVRSTRGRIRAQAVLDAGIALTALGALLEVLVPVAVGNAGPDADLLLTAGYPAVVAVLCAVGLVTFAGVSPPRRPAAGWLLLCFGALALVQVSGALAVGRPAPVLDVVTSIAYLGVLASATLALASDPGPRAAPDGVAAAVPLAGVVISCCLAFGVALVLLGGWALGRPLVPLEAITVAALVFLTFIRTLVWARDSARLTRAVLRTEAYFRTLVHRAADVTIVLDAEGRVTWISTAERAMAAGLSDGRHLEGLLLVECVHDDDRAELRQMLGGAPALDDGRGRMLRLRSRYGGWRLFETVRASTSAGLPAGTRDGVVLHLRHVGSGRSAELELERLAYTDYLTGLPNRARFMVALEEARVRAADGEPAGLLLVDLDGFKAVNDVAGHDAGDQLLCEVAGHLRNAARDGDLVARLGGDEFALLVPGTLEQATGVAERLVAVLGRSFRAPTPEGQPPGPLFSISGSVGVAQLRAGDEAAAAVRQADLALRAAKAAGKGCVRSTSEAIESAMGRRTRLARDLPAALEENQLRVVYQPVVGVAERRVLGLEALVRWEHPLLGTVPPDEFISLAEDDGLIVPLQRWVLGRATVDAAALRAAGWDLQMGVNVSVRHLQAGCLIPDVAQALAGAGLPAGNLHLEITESVMLGVDERLENDLTTLRDMGCVVSLDDFGRGYSSLAYLARLPVDILKMDREFVAGIDGDPRGAVLVASIIELGRTLGMDVVAEGVETPEQLAALRDMDIRYVQGYLLGRPLPLADVTAVLEGFDPAVLDGDVHTEMDTLVHIVGQDG